MAKAKKKKKKLTFAEQMAAIKPKKVILRGGAMIDEDLRFFGRKINKI